MFENKIGVLDPEGNKKNPLTGKNYQNLYEDILIKVPGVEEKVPGTYKNFSKIVHEQPLLKNKNHTKEILQKLKDYQVLVIESATGTGKTVVLPKLASHFLNYKGKVVVTVPKRGLAVSNADFCAKCMDVRLGEEVGFQHSGSSILEENEEGEEIERSSYNENTKIVFVTDGWLALKVSENLTLSEYGVIMIDEVHERNSNIDLLLLYLREALLLNNKLRVIITSATLEMDFFVNYFSQKGISVSSKTVSNKTNYDVKLIYENVKITGMNIIKEAVKAYDKYLNKKNIKEDCIIFVNSNPSADKICTELVKLNPKIYCIRATSGSITADPQLEDKAAKDPQKDPYLKELYKEKGYDRRVIVATEVWESSITLPLLKWVIEPGIALIPSYDGEKMMYSLLNKQIAQGQALQRKGRVGRSSNGTCIFLYSKKDFDKMGKSKIPAILKEDFSGYLLSWWSREGIETLGELINFTTNLIEIPKKEVLQTSLKSLYALEYSTGVSDRDDELTELGYFLSHQDYFLKDIRYTKAFYYANYYQCKDEVAVILSILGLQKGVAGLFVKCDIAPFSKGAGARGGTSDKAKDVKDCNRRLKRYKNKYGDMIAGLNAVYTYMQEKYTGGDMKEWSRKNYLNMSEIENVSKSYEKMIKKKYPLILFEENGEEKIDFKTKMDKIIYCLLKGFYTNLAQKVNTGGPSIKYKNLFPPKKTTAKMSDILEGNFMEVKSEYIIYDKLQEFDGGKQTFSSTLAIPEKFLDLLTPFEKEMIF